MKGRCAGAVALLSLAAPSFADRIVSMPTGTKTRSGYVLFEGLAQANGPQKAWLDAGLGTNWELNMRSTGDRWTLGATYQYLFPLIDLTPGLTFGVDDLRGVSQEGRGVFAAFTLQMANYGEWNQDLPTEFTLGIWARREGGPFFGASFPVAREFRFLLEHDARRITAGFEIRPNRLSGLKILFIDGAPAASLRFQAKF